ncbi:HNH endonuclease [Salmonella enterica]|nr:HNH endonuclease [Salmonella enterica]ECU1614239.1 HNH endonuclease [Salmonella enterica subsp. enterica serovar Typhimurium]
MALTRKQRERLRMKFGGRCAYCSCELPEKGWHADHVQAVLRKSERCMKAAEKGIFRLKSTGDVFRPEADCPENIFPSCAPCNLLKTTYSLEMFRKQVSLQVERGRRSSVNFRTAERFGLISVVNKPVVFWFEQYEGENK